jgi:hypothetical protein
MGHFHISKHQHHTPKHRAARQRRVAGPAITALSVATVLALSGCSIPGLPGPTGAPDVEPAAVIAPTTTQTEAAAPTAVPAQPTITGEMVKGTVSHKLGAAENQLAIDYWTTQNTASWTPDTSPIIRLSASVAGAETKAIKVTRFNARVDSSDTILANDTGDFAVDAPHSYSSSIVVPGNASALKTRLIFTIDLLTETAPGSGVYTRQTITDDLVLEFAVPAALVPLPSAAQN